MKVFPAYSVAFCLIFLSGCGADTSSYLTNPSAEAEKQQALMNAEYVKMAEEMQKQKQQKK